MMQRDLTRFSKMLDMQEKCAYIATFLALIAAGWIAKYLIDDGIFTAFVSTFMTFIAVRGLTNFVLVWFIHLLTYRGDWDSMHADATEMIRISEEKLLAANAPVEKIPTPVSITVVDRPEKPSGKWLDHDIYDWLDVKGVDGTVKRFNFITTADFNKIKSGVINLAPGSIVIPPGIVYQVESDNK